MEDKLSIVQLALELLADICVQDGSEGIRNSKSQSILIVIR